MPSPSLTRVHPARRSVHGEQLVTLDVSEELIGAAMGPFLFVSLFDMRAPVFPPHPHAGFSVATYILPESPIGFINQDSLGNRNRIAPGALHVTVAGSGVLHEEQPERLGSVARGFQIWIEHADAHREIAPAALHLAAEEVPQARLAAQSARVLLGEWLGVCSPISHATRARLIDLELADALPFEAMLDPDEHAFLLVHQGALRVGESAAATGEVVATIKPGGCLRLVGLELPVRATLFAGPAMGAGRVRHGPFVASSVEQMQRFLSRHRDGKFGQLRPFAVQR